MGADAARELLMRLDLDQLDEGCGELPADGLTDALQLLIREPFAQGGVAKLLVGAPTANRLTGTVYVEALPDGQ